MNTQFKSHAANQPLKIKDVTMQSEQLKALSYSFNYIQDAMTEQYVNQVEVFP